MIHKRSILFSLVFVSFIQASQQQNNLGPNFKPTYVNQGPAGINGAQRRPVTPVPTKESKEAKRSLIKEIQKAPRKS